MTSKNSKIWYEHQLKTGVSVETLISPHFESICIATVNSNQFILALEQLKVITEDEKNELLLNRTSLVKNKAIYKMVCTKNMGLALVKALEISRNNGILDIIYNRHQRSSQLLKSTTNSNTIFTNMQTSFKKIASQDLSSNANQWNEMLTFSAQEGDDPFNHIVFISGGQYFKGLSLIGYDLELGQLEELLLPLRSNLEYLKLDKVDLCQRKEMRIETKVDRIKINLNVLKTFIWNSNSYCNISDVMFAFGFRNSQLLKIPTTIEIKQSGQVILTLNKGQGLLVLTNDSSVDKSFFLANLGDSLENFSAFESDLTLQRISPWVKKINLSQSIPNSCSSLSGDFTEYFLKFKLLQELTIDNCSIKAAEFKLNLDSLLNGLEKLNKLILGNVKLIGKSVLNSSELVVQRKLIVLFKCLDETILRKVNSFSNLLTWSQQPTLLIWKKDENSAVCSVDQKECLFDVKVELQTKEFYDTFGMSTFFDFDTWIKNCHNWGF